MAVASGSIPVPPRSAGVAVWRTFLTWPRRANEWCASQGMALASGDGKGLVSVSFGLRGQTEGRRPLVTN